MAKLLMIADDFTGALDSGVKFAENGAKVRIIADESYEFEKLAPEIQVLVMDAETRHLDSSDAYKRVFEIVSRAQKAGIQYIYKKTDSALRGNIGSELTAMAEAGSNKVVHFIPAFPQMGRTTVNGVHYIDGIPVSESVFGKDPFEPITCSDIAELIGRQSKIPVKVVTDGTAVTDAAGPMIIVYDAGTDRELTKLASDLEREGLLTAVAGCAGLAEALPKLLCLQGDFKPKKYTTNQFLVACGSVNPITRKQLECAEAYGFRRICLTPWQKLEQEYFKTMMGRIKIQELIDTVQKEPLCILDTNDEPGRNDTMIYAREHGMSTEEVRVRIADTLGYLLKKMVQNGVDSTMLITGGDTLLGFMKQLKVHEMTPLAEIAPGTVLSEFEIGENICQVISKSGGFGSETLIVELAEQLMGVQKGRQLC